MADVWQTRRNKLPFQPASRNVITERERKKKRHSVLLDVAVADKHVAISPSGKLLVSSKVLAAVWDSVGKKEGFFSKGS